MNPVTLRRLLVFGVCAVGVGALYVVPALSGSAPERAAPLPEAEPSSRPTGSATVPVSRSARGTPRPEPTLSSTAPTPSPDRTQDASVRTPRATRPASSGATAYDPRTSTDRVAPDPVATITTAGVTRDRVTVSWPAAKDDIGVLRYRVVLNGFTVATTRKTHATVLWFNDDLGSHVIQVRALDAAGNESPSSPNLLVSRPTPKPTPLPTPSPSTTPTAPSPTPGASGSTPTPSTSPAPGKLDEEAVPLSPSASASATSGVR